MAILKSFKKWVVMKTSHPMLQDELNLTQFLLSVDPNTESKLISYIENLNNKHPDDYVYVFDNTVDGMMELSTLAVNLGTTDLMVEEVTVRQDLTLFNILSSNWNIEIVAVDNQAIKSVSESEIEIQSLTGAATKPVLVCEGVYIENPIIGKSREMDIQLGMHDQLQMVDGSNVDFLIKDLTNNRTVKIRFGENISLSHGDFYEF